MNPHFSLSISIQKSDIDELGHVNNVVYLRWVQEVAAAHWNFVASSELKTKYSWVVLRHEIDYRLPVFLKDNIIGSTWVGEYHGARFERFVKLYQAGSKKVVAEAKTIWCLLDGVTMKPKRIDEEILSLLKAAQ
jgi:acyl-CoA thioester hydrolase